MIETIGVTLILLAGLLHGYIFVLESFMWTTKFTMKTFSIPSLEEAEATREMAFNQGFYNLFLGLMAFLGSVVYWCGLTAVGTTLMFAGALSMVLAAAVLFISSPSNRVAALKQMTLPLIGSVLLVFALLL
jgi:putative membrane protein